MAQNGSAEKEAVQSYVENLFGYLGGAVFGTQIYLGDKLGLYKHLAEAGPQTPEQIAEAKGFSPRYVQEWLHGQASAKLIEFHESNGTYGLPAAGLAVVKHPENIGADPFGSFTYLPELFRMAEDKIPHCFQSGVGMTYDQYGRTCASGVKRFFAPWFETELVPALERHLPAVFKKLEEGALVADVGCGAGHALCVLAKRFPKSSFVGYDISLEALKVAKEEAAALGLPQERLDFKDAAKEPLPDSPTYDLITTFDCIHDMAFPSKVVAAIRKAIKPDGTWFVSDIRGAPRPSDNYSHPMSPMLYSFSVMLCMTSALSEKGGEGLGTLGFHEGKAREMAKAAGFSSFEVVPIQHPMNSYFLVKP
uniref:Uncharacterized protein n=1 Tax=Chromera velia CCMP2878 TaxID=1169474 RepID=A0A0G4IE80_9ALVE|eukprot:Cvel_13654.t1-p1 / transcript=Cvel_13654.t1 / gene=Cvel_13654 / organism=Chromera_velia_CCMP2878 / gene_product=hypothetical protein / transcript_product=hypothetical protein / location=Cvel_scaffold942:2678-6970(-) / protein_length=363 / sequence_SO=supercontig / SO=protein_coding / is_pseudo=false